MDENKGKNKIYDFKDKNQNLNMKVSSMFNRSLSMFEYENLPDTIPRREFEKILQMNGYAFITKFKGKLYALNGGLGGLRDAYYVETKITIANPYLSFYETLDINEDGVLIRNDDLKEGLLNFYNSQCTLLVENDINMLLWGYNNRYPNILTASDDKSHSNAKDYLKKIVDGELGIIGSNPMFDGIKVHGSDASNTSIMQMIEYHQYIKSSLYNEVGLSSNFNMKRERLISSELDQSEDSLFSLVYNMMENRLEGLKLVNEKYSTDIKIGFGSVWYHKNKKLVDNIVEDLGYSEVFKNSSRSVSIDQEPEPTPSTSEAIDQEPEPTPSTSEAIDQEPEPTPSTSEAIDQEPDPTPSTSEAIDQEPEPTPSTSEAIDQEPEPTPKESIYNKEGIIKNDIAETETNKESGDIVETETNKESGDGVETETNKESGDGAEIEADESIEDILDVSLESDENEVEFKVEIEIEKKS